MEKEISADQFRSFPMMGEQLQEDIRTHCDGLPTELITALCQAVVDFQNSYEVEPD